MEKYAYRVDEDKVKAVFYGARSPEATKTWPRATENIVQVIQPGDMLVLISSSQKARIYYLRFRSSLGRVAA